LKKSDSETHEAVVTFETEAAAKTALLLGNALIVDRPIVVVPYIIPEPTLIDFGDDVVVEGSKINNKTFAVPDDQRTKTSVIASMIASGFTLGEDVVKRGKEYDEKYSISAQVKSGVEEIKKTVLEVDKQLKFSETVVGLATATSDKIKIIDDKYAISATAEKNVKDIDQKLNISPTAEYVGQKVSENAGYIRNQALEFWNSFTKQPAVVSISTTYNEIATETNELIKKKQTAIAAPPGNAPVDAVPVNNALVNAVPLNNAPANGIDPRAITPVTNPIIDANGELPLSGP